MTSEIRANTIKNRVGLGTVSYTNTGIVVSGIVTANSFSGPYNGTDIVGTGLTLTSTDAGSAAGPEVKLFRNSASPANADYLGQLKFAGESSTGVERNYAKITGKILDVTNGSEDGILEFAHIKAGAQTITGRWRSDSLQLLNGTNLTINGDLDVDRHTNLDNVSIAGVTTMTGALTISSTTDQMLNLNSSDNNGTSLAFQRNGSRQGYIGYGGASAGLIIANEVNNGDIAIQGKDGGSAINMLSFNAANKGLATLHGGATIPLDLDVDGHTNLDNVSISGISSTGNIYITTGGDGRKLSFAGDGSSHYIKMDHTLNGPIINGYGGIAFETNGTNERLRITSGGVLNVPAGIGPQLRFENQHSVTTDAAISTFDDASGTLLCLGSNFYINSSGSETRYNTSEESTGIILNRQGYINFNTGGTGATAVNRIQITETGKVQIGLPGTSAGLAGGVEVVNIRAASNANLHVRNIGSLTSSPAGSGVGIDVLNDASNTVMDLCLRGHGVIFRNRTAETLRISENANLLLGTTTDSQRLHVYNNNGGTGYKTAFFNSNDTTNGTRVVIGNTGNTSGRGLGFMVGGNYAGSDKASIGWFNTDNTFVTHSIMTFTSAGKVGINQTSPTSNLHVGGAYNETGATITGGALGYNDVLQCNTANGHRRFTVAGDGTIYGPSGGRKNWFDNGSFDCFGGRRANTSMDYGNHHAYGWVTDRFQSRNSVQWSRSTNVPAGKGFSYSTQTNGGGGTLVQAVELPDYGDMGVFAPNSYWCVSVWSTSPLNQGGQAFSYDLGSTKTGISIVHPSSGGSYQTTGETASGTSTGTFSRYYMVFQMPSSIISGATSAYWTWGFTNAGYATGFQLERVPTSTSKPTPYEHVHPAVTTARCRRYAYQIVNSRLVMGYVRHDGNCNFPLQHPVPPTHMPSGPNQSVDPYGVHMHDAGMITNFQSVLQNPGLNNAARTEFDYRSGRFMLYGTTSWSSTHTYIPSWESQELEFTHGHF